LGGGVSARDDDDRSAAPLLTRAAARGINAPSFGYSFMPKPRFHVRHICRTYYLSEWWDE
jgi:hypothetical protein